MYIDRDKKGVIMDLTVKIPELNIKEEEIRFLLAQKLFEEGLISIGKAAEVSGYSEKTFTELLLRKGIPPFKYSGLNLRNEINNA